MSRRLFELVTHDGCSISPYVWRIKYALALKGLAYEPCGVGFVDIPDIGPGGFRTVPVLEDDDRWVTDSWAIARHLDETYRATPCLFTSAGEHALAQFFEKWIAAEVITYLFRICAFDIHNRLREGDRPYFRRSREARLGVSLEAAHAERSTYLAELPSRVRPMRLALQSNCFIGGEGPGYADFIAAGAFIWAGSVSTAPLLPADDPLLDWLDRCLALYGGIGLSLSLPGLHRDRVCAADQRPKPCVGRTP